MKGSIKDVSKMNVRVPKRKCPTDAAVSPDQSKRKKFKSNTSVVSSSRLSLTASMAFGVSEEPDETDYDEDLVSTAEVEKPFVQLNKSQLSRENGVLFSEDLNDDYEIWTLQCPDDVNINELREQAINFYESDKLFIKNKMSNKVDMIPYRSQEDTKITILTPSENTNNLSLNVVPLAGTIIMSNHVKKEKLENHQLLPVDTIEDATKRRSSLMLKITQRLSNKYDDNTTDGTSIKKEIKIEKESPVKVKKSKKKN